MMKRVMFFMLAVALLATPTWAVAQVTQSNGARTLSPGDNVQAGANSTSTSTSTATGGAGGSVGPISNTNVFVPTNVNSNTQGQEQGQHQGQGQLQGQKQGQGQGQSQNNKQVIAPSQSVNMDTPAQAPAIFAPNLTSSPEACMGSVSAGGGAGFGGTSFGITFGTTWTNDQCQDRMNARTLGSLGQNQAALEYLAATNPKIADALKKAGVKLATLEPPVVAAVPVVEQGGTKVEKKDIAKADGPFCSDGKPAKLRPSGFYSCYGYDR